MTTTNWTGKAGTTDFNTAGNWDDGIPTATVDAFIIGLASAPVTVTYTSGTDSVHSLTTDFSTLTVSGGSLTILSGATVPSQEWLKFKVV